MYNATFQDVVSYYTPRLAEQKSDKRNSLESKISDKKSKIGDKNSKIQDLLSDIRDVHSDIRSIELEIASLPSNKQYKAEGKRSKIETKKAKIDDKQSRILEIQNETIPAIQAEIEEIKTEIAGLDKRYEAKLQDYIDNFGTYQVATINDKWYKIPYGTSVSMIGLQYFFYYLGKEIVVEECLQEDCAGLDITNCINSKSGNITMSNITIGEGIFISNIIN